MLIRACNPLLCPNLGPKDVGTGQTITRFRGHSGKINSIKFNKDNTVILSASYDATIKCWDMRSSSHEPIMSMTEVFPPPPKSKTKQVRFMCQRL